MFLGEDITYDGFSTLNFKQLIRESENVTNEFSIKDSDSNIALTLYTSGSTGTPKGISLTKKLYLSKAMSIISKKFFEDVYFTI